MSADDQTTGRLGPYRLLDRIGEGGMGVVYLARDSKQRTVAVKVLRPHVAAEPNALRRLAREVETMHRVRSPYVSEVISADLTGPRPYIATRYVPGQTLDQVVATKGPLQGEALAGLARGLAEALAAVHAAGVVHRDLKPGNVMMVGGSPVVIDFGIAQGPDATRLTQTGMFMGTPGYLAPEVIEGQPSSEASDVHAWGATVAFAATGRPPYGTGSYESIFYKIVNGQHDLVGAPVTLVPLLAAAMARDPSHRPPAIQLSALARVLEPGRLVPGPAGGPQLVSPASVTQAEGGPPGQPAVPGGAGRLAAAGAGAAGLLAAGAPAGGAAAGLAAGALGNGANGAGVRAIGQPPACPPAVRPADYSGVLPPVNYRQAQGGGPGSPAVAGPATAAERKPASPRGHALIATASMVVLVCASVVLPVIGTAAALVVIALLRAGNGAWRGTAIRRSSRGARASDPLVAAVSFPWHLVRSVFGLLMLAPVALAFGAVVAGITMITVQVDQLPHAVAYGAGALVAFYALGPRSALPRHQLSHLYARITPTRIIQTAALMLVTALAAGAITTAASSPPLYSPVQPPTGFSHLGSGLDGPFRFLHDHLSHLGGR